MPNKVVMEPFAEFVWPVEMLGRILHFLAMDGASIPWQHLAYLTHKPDGLIQLAKKMQRPLVLRIGFDRQDEDKTFILPFKKADVAHIEIDWGDDSTPQIINNVEEGCAKHEYKAGGEYTVRVFPHGPAVNGSWLNHLGWNTIRSYPQEWYSWRPLRSFDTLGSLGIQSLEALFYRARSFNLPLSHLDVSGVVNMSSMLLCARDFNQPIGNWNVSNVTDMQWMFASCVSFDQPISRWNVSRVTSMRFMFCQAAKFNQPIGDWDTSNLTDATSMFQGCTYFNQDISGWNMSQVREMPFMFSNAKSFNQPIGCWDVSSVTNMEAMFRGAESFAQDLNDWDVSNATSVRQKLVQASKFD